MKPYRQALILELIEREAITSQEGLRARLLQRGVATTQATLSRDIRDLRLVKQAPDGAYRRADMAPATNGSGSDSSVAQAVADYLRRYEVVAQMLVLRTDPGGAQPLWMSTNEPRTKKKKKKKKKKKTLNIVFTPEDAIMSFTRSWMYR